MPTVTIGVPKGTPPIDVAHFLSATETHPLRVTPCSNGFDMLLPYSQPGALDNLGAVAMANGLVFGGMTNYRLPEPEPPPEIDVASGVITTDSPIRRKRGGTGN